MSIFGAIESYQINRNLYFRTAPNYDFMQLNKLNFFGHVQGSSINEANLFTLYMKKKLRPKELGGKTS